jgi:phytoene dehydrogenase-like protein
MKRYFWLVMGTILGVVVVVLFLLLSESQKRRIIYLAGASSHPGGGVPITITSGMVVADLVAKDVG